METSKRLGMVLVWFWYGSGMVLEGLMSDEIACNLRVVPRKSE
jgi:hypothetical protein